jgi:hydrogenase maturation protein HypF
VQLSAASTSKKRIKITVFGVVQGVGFRPFVYQLAKKLHINGFIYNNEKGVVIEAEASQETLNTFVQEIKKSPPPLAKIDSIDKEQIALVKEDDFVIQSSKNASQAVTMLCADISLCPECAMEMEDVRDRRYAYPFINCTNCGPRYTIIQNLPYDRKNTSMSEFEMCKDCLREYKNPDSRRYHAQPISCHNCGPQLFFIDMKNNESDEYNSPLDKAVEKLKAGEIIALKGLGGFHILCDAQNQEALLTLRKKKPRPTKPLAVMFSSIEAIQKVAKLTKQEQELICSKERPIVIVSKKESQKILAEAVAPNIDKIGVFLPYTPLHKLLLDAFGGPLVATSANLSDEPIITKTADVISKLSHLLCGVLSHNRKIINACDDSVAMALEKQNIFLRLARGYAPKSLVSVAKANRHILALGAQQKNSMALGLEHNMVLSAHIGDLNSLEAFEFFTRTRESFERIYNFEPEVLVCDKHPAYETTLWAKEQKEKRPHLELLEVQHHYAHALAVMAEYGLDEDVLAFCFDGTGYGDDATLWGGEVLIASPHHYKRILHLQHFSLLGAQKAIKEPKRVGLALLFEIFDYEELLALHHPLLESFSNAEIKTLFTMYTKKLNTVVSSSVGRLFDAVYALSGYTQALAYEGESGLVLERIASQNPSDECYSYTIEEDIISYKEMIREIVREPCKEKIAAKFINTLAAVIVDIAKRHRDLAVVLCGGVFQNRLLLEKLIAVFEEQKISYFIPREIPVNDGGIALGQLYYAMYKYKG